MKAIVTTLLALSILVPRALLAADTDGIVTTLIHASPQGWEVKIDNNSRPPWTRTDDRCIRVELYGPNLGGYKYYNASGELIAEKRLAHESIIVWVTPRGFDDGWNFVSRFLNWFAPWAIEFPSQVGERNGVHIYAQESYLWLHEEWREDSPKGTLTAIFYPPPGGRTWTGWRADLKRVLKN